FRGFFAIAVQRWTAFGGRVIVFASIIVTKLDKHKVARLDLGENLIPTAFILKRAAAASADGAVDHVDLRGIKKRAEFLSPAAHRRVALKCGVHDDKEGRQLVVRGLLRSY